jgi:hypothetical protein
MRRACAVVLVAVAGAAAVPGVARAADVTDVASSFDEDNPFDFRFRFRYDHTEQRAQIKRELEGLSPSQTTILVDRDLLYAFRRDSISLRAEFGLFQDLMLHAELPIILGESQDYSFDQSDGNACRYPPDPMPSCVNASNSTTIADGLVPSMGYDAQNGGVGLPAGAMIFRGVKRGAISGSGLDAFDTFNFGLTWAPVNQRRDDTKPTWVLALEPQISIGNIMAFDRARPNVNHAVSEGIHHILARTAISRYWSWSNGGVEPYIGFWYSYPIARGDSLFKDYGPSEKLKNPQQQGGTLFGLELVPFERPHEGHKIWIDLRGRLEGHFNGRGYSEMWELLASAGPLNCDTKDNHAAFNPACDPAQTTNLYQNQAYTGITTIENYASLGVDIALGVQVGQHARFRASFDYAHDQAHFVTGEDIGVPTTSSGRVMLPSEFNPAYRPVVDQVGRRYRVDNSNWYNFGVWGQMQF